MLLTGSLLIDEARLKDLDEVEKERDELQAKYDEPGPWLPSHRGGHPVPQLGAGVP